MKRWWMLGEVGKQHEYLLLQNCFVEDISELEYSSVFFNTDSSELKLIEYYAQEDIKLKEKRKNRR